MLRTMNCKSNSSQTGMLYTFAVVFSGYTAIEAANTTETQTATANSQGGTSELEIFKLISKISNSYFPPHK